MTPTPVAFFGIILVGGSGLISIFSMSSELSTMFSISIACARFVSKTLSLGKIVRYFSTSCFVFSFSLSLLIFILARAPTRNSLLSNSKAVACE